MADLITAEHGIILHTENGMLGVGPVPTEGGGAMDYPVNAGKIPVTALEGSSYFDSADSFAMIRGGHIDVAIMVQPFLSLRITRRRFISFTGFSTKGVCSSSTESESSPNQFLGEDTHPFTVRYTLKMS